MNAAFDLWRGFGAPRWLMAPGVLALMFAVGMGVVVGYHRMLTHRAARFVRPLELFLVVSGLGAGTPTQWVGNHRYHHAHADTPLDPHSPKHRGFWVAHCGWYLGTSSTFWSIAYACLGPLRTIFDAFYRPRTNQGHVDLAKDIAGDPLLAWLSRPGPYALVLLTQVALLWLLFILAWGVPGAGAMTFVHFAAYLLGDGINSFGHLMGKKTFATGDESRDSALMALLTFGDGWHNAHHAFPGWIRAGLAPGQIDVAWVFVKVCAKLGLAYELREPSPAALERALRSARIDDPVVTGEA